MDVAETRVGTGATTSAIRDGGERSRRLGLGHAGGGLSGEPAAATIVVPLLRAGGGPGSPPLRLVPGAWSRGDRRTGTGLTPAGP